MSPIRKKKLPPKKHQFEARDKVIAALKKHPRVQLIMPCGTGKTLVSLMVR